MKVRELKTKRAALISQARAVLDKAERETRPMTAEEDTAYKAALDQADQVGVEITRLEDLEAREAELGQLDPRQSEQRPQAPAVLRIGRGDTEARMVAHYIRTGDASREMVMGGMVPDRQAVSNDTDMNITTSADGGYAVPTGHYQGIIAKRNEGALFIPLGCMPIPGRGTTVNVPVESGSANVFVSTAEAYGSGFDRDAPVLDQKALTLVKYTKKVQLSTELLEDEDSNLIAFLNDYVGRALALTHNSLLVTEALANGTSVALGAAAAATAGDPETVIYTLQSEYADNAKWVMRRATEGAYRKLTGNLFLYQVTPNGSERSLGGHPIFNAASVAAIGAGNKSSILGNFNYMGYRQGGLTFLRDPYSSANTGQVNLFYYVRIDYAVLNADAILYGKHPTA